MRFRYLLSALYNCEGIDIPWQVFLFSYPRPGFPAEANEGIYLARGLGRPRTEAQGGWYFYLRYKGISDKQYRVVKETDNAPRELSSSLKLPIGVIWSERKKRAYVRLLRTEPPFSPEHKPAKGPKRQTWADLMLMSGVKKGFISPIQGSGYVEDP